MTCVMVSGGHGGLMKVPVSMGSHSYLWGACTYKIIQVCKNTTFILLWHLIANLSSLDDNDKSSKSVHGKCVNGGD